MHEAALALANSPPGEREHDSRRRVFRDSTRFLQDTRSRIRAEASLCQLDYPYALLEGRIRRWVRSASKALKTTHNLLTKLAHSSDGVPRDPPGVYSLNTWLLSFAEGHWSEVHKAGQVLVDDLREFERELEKHLQDLQRRPRVAERPSFLAKAARDGFVAVSVVMNDARFAKDGKNPTRSTIQVWENKAKREGDASFEARPAPDTGEAFFPKDWVLVQIEHWHPRKAHHKETCP